MDGALLVLDSRTLPHLHALAPIDAPIAAAPRAHWRHRTFPAMAALILASVFSLVYFVSTQRSVRAPAAVSGASIAVPAPALPSAVEATEAVPAASEVEPAKEQVKEEARVEPKSAPAPAPVKKASSKAAPITERKPAEEPKKDESKVGSILKKTGRILKKPFKF